jgi:hypothetical protein
MERRALFQNYLRTNTGESLDQTEAARTMLDMWREVPSLEDDTSFCALLDSYALTPEAFVMLLSAAPEELACHLDALPTGGICPGFPK